MPQQGLGQSYLPTKAAFHWQADRWVGLITRLQTAQASTMKSHHGTDERRRRRRQARSRRSEAMRHVPKILLASGASALRSTSRQNRCMSTASGGTSFWRGSGTAASDRHPRVLGPLEGTSRL